MSVWHHVSIVPGPQMATDRTSCIESQGCGSQFGSLVFLLETEAGGTVLGCGYAGWRALGEGEV